MTKKPMDGKAEIHAISAVYDALKILDSAAQLRVLRYCAGMLGLTLDSPPHVERVSTSQDHDSNEVAAPTTAHAEASADDVEGISAVALKWMKRSALTSKELQMLFSLGIDEIDLVAESVPGSSKRERMRNVILLKGIAAYLSSGTPRVTYEQLKEAALHYSAYDATNFAAHLKSFSAEVGGSKDVGFTLTPRGLTAATTLVKAMVAAS